MMILFIRDMEINNDWIEIIESDKFKKDMDNKIQKFNDKQDWTESVKLLSKFDKRYPWIDVIE